MKKLFIPLALVFTALAGVCFVSWVSSCNIGDYPDFVADIQNYRNTVTPPWVHMNPPWMSLYVSIPGFFTSLLAAIVSLGNAS